MGMPSVETGVQNGSGGDQAAIRLAYRHSEPASWQGIPRGSGAALSPATYTDSTSAEDAKGITVRYTATHQAVPLREGSSSRLTMVIKDAAKPKEEKNYGPRDPEITVSLDMFTSEKALCESPFAKHIVDRQGLAWLIKIGDEERFAGSEQEKRNRYIEKHGESKVEDYDRQRAKDLNRLTTRAKTAINDKVYATLMEDFDLASIQDAKEYYARQTRHANAAVMTHGQLIYAEGTVPEVSLPDEPADLMALYVNKTTSKDLKHRILDTFLLGYITGEIEMNDRNGADQKLSQISTLLNKKLFKPKDESKNQSVRYAVFDNETNAIDADRGITEVEPTDIPSNAHVKTIIATTRTVADTDEEVVTKYSKKNTSNAARKALRKAKKKIPERGHDQVRPDLDVNDTHRMMLVTFGGKEDAKALVHKVFDVIADKDNARYFETRDENGTVMRGLDGHRLGIPRDVEISHESANEEDGKSEFYDRYRIKIFCTGQSNPTEIVVQTAKEAIDGNHRVGRYNPETGRYDGPAHPAFALGREAALQPVLVPDVEPTPDIHGTVQALRQAATIIIESNDFTEQAA